MVPVGTEVTAGLELDPALSDGTLMGKRYVDDAGAEVLVTKAGKGTLEHRHHPAGHQGSQAAARQRLSPPPPRLLGDRETRGICDLTADLGGSNAPANPIRHS